MGETRGLTPEPTEREPEVVRPRVYVASLSDYNDGRLHGCWIDATQDAETIQAEVNAMLHRSPMPDAEEWAIHDYEGFGPLHLSEYESFDTVSRIASGIAEHGEAFAHWAACTGSTSDGTLALFDDMYLGTWPSVHDFAESLIETFGVEEALDRANLPFRNYIRIDTDMLARDVQIENYVSEGAEGVHIFYPI